MSRFGELRRHPTAEKRVDRRDADGICPLGGANRRIDTQAGHPMAQEIPEEVAVVARHLDDPALRPEPTFVDQSFRNGGGMFEKGGGRRGVVGVIALIERVWRNGLAHLEQRAVRAKQHGQRISLLLLPERIASEQRVRDGVIAQIQDDLKPRAPAGPTHQHFHFCPPKLPEIRERCAGMA